MVIDSRNEHNVQYIKNGVKRREQINGQYTRWFEDRNDAVQCLIDHIDNKIIKRQNEIEELMEIKRNIK
jgi:hypothetical protein